MNQQPLTLEAVERFLFDAETRRLRDALLEARKTARITRDRVNSYILPLFQTFRFVRSGPFAGERAGEPITEPSDLYLTDQEDEVQRYFAACYKAHQAHGYRIPEQGSCPALMAESALVKAEQALLDHAAMMLAIDFRNCCGSLRERALAILDKEPATPQRVGARRRLPRSGGRP